MSIEEHDPIKKKILILKKRDVPQITSRDYLTPTSWIDFGTLPKEIEFGQTEFDELWNVHPIELGKIKIYGNVIDTPRYQGSYLQPYHFTGVDHPIVEDLPPIPVIRLFKWVNTMLSHNGVPYGIFNEIFINWYEDGTHYIGPHFDKQLVIGSPIFSVSLGATRTFQLTDPKHNNKIVKTYNMIDNSYLVMGGDLNKTYKHGVPAIKPASVAKATGKRINITFRMFETDIPEEIKQRLNNIK